MEREHGFTESTIDKEGNRNKFFYLGPKNNWQEILEAKISKKIEQEFEQEMKELKYL